ncbi:MAG: hypothetical protein U0031_22525 [Thermomicrobiales bacterium]
MATRFVTLLLVLYVLKQIFTVAAFYPFSGHDEVAHYAYIRQLVDERRLPVLPDLASWRASLVGSEPPPIDQIPDDLYPYCRFTLDWYCEPNNPRWARNPPRIVTVPGYGYFPSGYQYVANHPPLYYILVSPVLAATQGLSLLSQQYALRLAAIPFGLLTVFAAYRMTRTLFPGDAFLAVTVPAAVAFQPQISYEAAMINNDIVAIAIVAVLLWGIVVACRDRFPVRLSVMLGAGLGLGLLAKSTVIAVAPVIGLAMLAILGWRNWKIVLARGSAIGIPAALLTGPWYVYLHRTYGDFNGLDRVAALQYWNSPMGRFAELLLSPDFAIGRFRETWGEYGWRLIHYSDRLLWALAIPVVLSLIGLLIYAFKVVRGVDHAESDVVERPSRWQQVALGALALTCVLAYLAVVQFGTEFALSQARYFFPAAGAAALLGMLGLRTLVPRHYRFIGQGVIFGSLVVMNLVIYFAYVLPFTAGFDQPYYWTWGG